MKGQNDVIMLVSERNCNEIVPQREAVRRCGLSVLLLLPKVLVIHIVWSDGSAEEVISEECI